VYYILKPLLLALLSLTISSTIYAQSSITPIPKTLSYDKEQALLGKKLFQDPILSKDGSIACSSCHNLTTNGASKTPFSFGIKGKETKVNTPTVFNSVFNFVQFYNGRAKTLKEQAIQGMSEPTHIDITIKDVVAKLKTSSYEKSFQQIFNDGLTQENFLSVIVEFEKALITPNSKFDNFLRGDTTVLNSQEKKGYKEFQKDGCINCHNGVNIGSNMYQKMGLFVPYRAEKTVNGRYDITNRERDKFVYKVPSLRNIADTAPYFHDGGAKTLSDAVIKMYEHQLGKKVTKKEVSNIVAFLKTLSAPKPKILEEGTK